MVVGRTRTAGIRGGTDGGIAKLGPCQDPFLKIIIKEVKLGF